MFGVLEMFFFHSSRRGIQTPCCYSQITKLLGTQCYMVLCFFICPSVFQEQIARHTFQQSLAYPPIHSKTVKRVKFFRLYLSIQKLSADSNPPSISIHWATRNQDLELACGHTKACLSQGDGKSCTRWWSLWIFLGIPSGNITNKGRPKTSGAVIPRNTQFKHNLFKVSTINLSTLLLLAFSFPALFVSALFI